MNSPSRPGTGEFSNEFSRPGPGRVGMKRSQRSEFLHSAEEKIEKETAAKEKIYTDGERGEQEESSRESDATNSCRKVRRGILAILFPTLSGHEKICTGS